MICGLTNQLEIDVVGIRPRKCQVAHASNCNPSNAPIDPRFYYPASNDVSSLKQCDYQNLYEAQEQERSSWWKHQNKELVEVEICYSDSIEQVEQLELKE